MLLVEDNDHVREFACHLLDELGYRVVTAASGEEASSQLRQRVDETRTALAEQARELFAQIDESQTRFAAAATDTGGNLAGRLDAARQLVELISAGIAAEEAASLKLIAGLGAAISSLDERLVAVGQRSDEIGDMRADAAQLVRLQDARTSLVAADAAATNAFLVGGLEPAPHEDEETVRELMVNMIDPKPGARILDVGCGTGRARRKLSRPRRNGVPSSIRPPWGWHTAE